MKVVIIEDEPLAAKNLLQLLNHLNEPVEIAAVLKSAKAAKEYFQKNSAPDLIFSDIQLSDGVSFEIFENNTEISAPVIFTTAFNEYAIRAFKLNSIDYLLKPIDENELIAAIDKYKKHIYNHVFTDQLSGLIKDLTNPASGSKKYKERFLVVVKNALMPLATKDIAYFVRDELIYAVNFESKRYICESNTLEEIENLLNPQYYFRANRQYIIYIDTIAQIKSTHKGLTITLKSPLNTSIDISREKAREFKEWVEQT